MNIWIDVPDSIKAMQAIQFWIMRNSSFNNFNGDLVVDSLLKHRDLWYSAVFIGLGVDIVLRDLPTEWAPLGLWNCDTLLLAVESHNMDAVMELASSEDWHADEVDWLPEKHNNAFFLQDTMRVLRVWWD